MTRLIVVIVLLSALFARAEGQASAEQTGDPSLRTFLPQWQQAQNRFINGDPALWKQNASHGEDVTIFGAFGGHEKGWSKVGPRNDWASSQFQESGATQQIEYLNTGASGDLAFTVAIERQQARIKGQEKLTPRSLRVTQIFRKENGAWKLLHRHADPLVERRPPSTTRREP